jgi:hypothetical protein
VSVPWWKRRGKLEINLQHKGEGDAVPIASDAAMISRGIADGRLIPVIILDTSARPDIDDMIRAHVHFGPGDATSAWSVPSWNKVVLILTVIHPSRCVVIISFDVVRQASIVDQIVQTQALYIMAGRPGDRLIAKLEEPRICVEIPSAEFRPTWEKLFFNAMVKDFRAHGVPRSEAKDRVRAYIAEWRELTSQRMKSEHDAESDEAPE